MKTWKILSDDTQDLVKTLLVNRGLKTKNDQENFLNPVPPSRLRAKLVGIDTKEISKAVSRVIKAIKDQEQIVVYGDYDCDGICATAILWKTLHFLGANVLPYIPDRLEEGYGLSEAGLNNLKEKIPQTKLVITVDHGIVAVEQTKYAREKLGFEVIITDHHTKAKKLPKALAIVHTTQLAGSGVSWFLAKEIISYIKRHSGETAAADDSRIDLSAEVLTKEDSGQARMTSNSCLDLAALGTIADLVPLQGPNRSIAKFGLEEIHQTKRVGLLALIREAGLAKENVETYEVSYILAPRLNALGRIDNALDALRLLCTSDAAKSARLARRLNEVNGERQKLTEETTIHARENSKFASRKRTCSEQAIRNSKLIFISHETYNQGVIGLVAGRLVEEFYRPAIVVAKSAKISKGSARSISGFNIVEAIRTFSDLLIDVGGHPMAAGFTVETGKLTLLEEKLSAFAQKQITDDQLVKQLKIDLKISLDQVTDKLWNEISALKPFGMANPEPIFATEVEVVETRLVGNTSKHLKLLVKPTSPLKFPLFNAIAFNFADLYSQIKPGDKIQIAYSVAKDNWRGRDGLQLKIKDIKI